jgi:hypothetical protein
MDQTTARHLARAVNAADPQAVAVATTVDAQAGRWEKTHDWIVTRKNGPTYYEVPADVDLTEAPAV